MADYVVMVQNREESTDNISVTGMVNKIQVAAVLSKRRLPPEGPERDAAIDEAMVDAYLALTPTTPSAVGRTVTR